MTVIIGWATILLACLSYYFYFRDIFRGTTKPNATTRLIWSFLNIFIFIQQVTYGGGPGAWVTGVTALANITLFFAALKYGQHTIKKFDWICLILAVLILILWRITANAELAVVLASGLFVVGLIPTLVKSHINAREETAITYGLNSLKFLLALFALSSVSLVTALYPLVLFVVNGLFFLYLLSRQSALRHLEERS